MAKLKLATWNINSVRLRIGRVAAFVAARKPDVLCLQEIKCESANFPFEALRELGFKHIEVHGQKGYHGVAVASRYPLERRAAADFNGTGEARHLAVAVTAKKNVSPVVVHNFYVPSGGDVPDPAANPKFAQKLGYLQAMSQRFEALAGPVGANTVLVGDLNVAPLEHDVWSHKDLLGVVSHTPIEVDHLNAAIAAGNWQDIGRRFVPPDQKLYTWWSYRASDWRASNRGRRLDHIWASPDLAPRVASFEVADDERDGHQPSDHVPVIATIDVS